MAGASYAQIQAGNKYIGSTVGGSFETPNGVTRFTSISVKPMVGHFLSDNWVVGISGEFKRDFNNQKSTISSPFSDFDFKYISNSTRHNTFAVGPVARYYQPLNQKLALFGEGIMGYSATNQKTNVTQRFQNSGSSWDEYDVDNSFKTQQLYAHIAPGLVFFPKTKLGIELKATLISYIRGMGESPYNSFISSLDPHLRDAFIFAHDPSKQRSFKTNFSLSATSLGIGYYF